MNFKIFLTLIASLSFGSSYGQGFKVSGTVKDSTHSFELPFVSVSLFSLPDTIFQSGVYTDTAGNFAFNGVLSGVYLLKTNFLGYKENHIKLQVNKDYTDLTVLLASSVQQLSGVVLKGQIPPVEQKGDTTVFNASEFKTIKGSDADALIKKMPGITTENGALQAQGEKVSKVYVDGKPFFGDDPALALKSLPADLVDKVEVYEKASDQAAFSGVDDGDKEKVINIVTKIAGGNGQFGKVYAGYGWKDKYLAGGNANIFNGSRRISIVGLSNNINQQNFSSEDLAGVSSQAKRGGYGRHRNDNFLVGQQEGITSTNALGINFSDSIGKKINFTGSYFFNRSDNKNVQLLDRTYSLSSDSNRLYKENSNERNISLGHRMDFRIEYFIDSSNSIIATPKLSLQSVKNSSDLGGSNYKGLGNILSQTVNNSDNASNALDFRNRLLYRHAFHKKGRTFSARITTNYSKDKANNTLQSLNQYFTEMDKADSINQEMDLKSSSYELGANLTYTEPISKQSQVFFRYESSFSKDVYDKETFDLLGNILDSNLSGAYEARILTNRGGLGYSFRTKKTMLRVGVDLQQVNLDNQQLLPSDFSMKKPFVNLLPNAMFRYNISKEQNIRLFYRSSTDVPSIRQLQGVVDNSNPLIVSTGNPNLKQEYSNRIYARASLGNSKRKSSLSGFLFVQNTKDYIGNALYLPSKDSIVQGGFLLKKGTQLSSYANLDGYWNVRANLSYGFPLNIIKSNLSLTSGYGYSKTPGMINNALTFSRRNTFTEGLTLGSNFSDKLDFTLTYSANLNAVKNSLQPLSNNNYFLHTLELKAEWIVAKGFLVQSYIGDYLYRGLGSGFNQDYVLWNVGFGKKLFKEQQGELRLSVSDLLNQNTSVSRNVTETYVEDVQNNILNRYFLLTFTYNFKNYTPK